MRITHIPTGIVVAIQDEKSQHKNKAKAMSVLRARFLEMEQRKAHEAEAEARRSMVGSGDRSEKIRTYNYPAGSGHRPPNRTWTFTISPTCSTETSTACSTS